MGTFSSIFTNKVCEMSEELQEEELLALEAIFEDDENYTKISDREIHYKVKSDDGDTNKNFLVIFKWPDNYPEEKPDISMDSFFNTHLNDETKEAIIQGLNEQAESNLG